MVDRTRQRLYRTAALERLSSPEELDALITVTRPRAWLAMAALWLGLLALVTWSITGRIATRLGAEGVILGGQLLDVSTTWGGRVQQLHVQAGDTVQRGQRLATVEQPELALQVQNQVARLRDLREEFSTRSKSSDRVLTLQRRFSNQQSQYLETSAREQDVVVRSMLARVDGERVMLERGLLSPEAALQSQQLLNAARDALARTRGDLVQLGATQLAAETAAEQLLVTNRQAVSDAERELRRLQNDYALRTTIVSPSPGVVLERSADAGDVLSVGQSIATLRVPEGRARVLRALLYVPGAEGKRVRAGMEIQVAPSSVRAEEVGYMVARVRSVTELPASSQALKQVLRNDALISSVSRMASPFQVDAEFVRDTSAAGGYRWTSSAGAASLIDPGTPASALIVVERRRPIELVIPALRRLFHAE